jgi:hypothetical protein
MTASNVTFGLKRIRLKPTKVFIGITSNLMITENELLNTQYLDVTLLSIIQHCSQRFCNFRDTQLFATYRISIAFLPRVAERNISISI